MKNKELGFPEVQLSRLNPEPRAISLIPEDIARKYNVVPISVIGKILTIATGEPADVLVFDDLKSITGYQIRICLAERNEVTETIEKWYRKEAEAFSKILEGAGEEKPLEILQEEQEKEEEALLAQILSDPDKGISIDTTWQEPKEESTVTDEETQDRTYIKGLIDQASQERVEVFVGGEVMTEEVGPENLAAQADQAPIVRLVDHILLDGYLKRASDIHLEPYEKRFRLRHRIDGILYEEFNIPLHLVQALIARLKIISNLNITEKRLPQDGRFKMNIEKKAIDYRVSILPISFGEKVVMRALDSSTIKLKLSDLGFSLQAMETMERMIRRPYGMILVTGPTGSGKSTTLSAVINDLNTPERNIMTIEDPVEYQIPGITQIPVNPNIGFTFADGLRSLLRQSPDIIMVGEIRDFETADIAVKAALTGQLVLSTLHTNDAASAINRLVDMGVEPFLVSSSVIMILAQRLVRKICRFCRAEVEIPAAVLANLGIEPASSGNRHVFYAGKGCEKCRQTGYHGRVAIGEVLVMDEELKELAGRSVSTDEINKMAIAKGMSTLRESAINNLKEGITTVEEIIRVTSEE
ncbi:MAG: ATPase, T2SS/T4P/T4SS family [Candidatus Omnitrophota bacterium]